MRVSPLSSRGYDIPPAPAKQNKPSKNAGKSRSKLQTTSAILGKRVSFACLKFHKTKQNVLIYQIYQNFLPQALSKH